MTDETDFAFLLALPGEEKIPFFLQAIPILIVWKPKELEERETNWLKLHFSHRILLNELTNKSDEHSIRMRTHLTEIIEEESARTKEIVTDIYFAGNIILNGKKTEFDLREPGLLPFNRLIELAAQDPLSEIYPAHREIMPYTETITRHDIERLWKDFIIPGRLSGKETREKGLSSLIESIMLPLGFAKRKGAGYQVVWEPGENKILREFLLEKENRVDDIYRSLRKSKYGITRNLFDILLLVGISQGYVTPYRNRRPMNITSIRDIYQIQELRGARLVEKHWLLEKLSFIFPDIELVPYGLEV